MNGLMDMCTGRQIARQEGMQTNRVRDRQSVSQEIMKTDRGTNAVNNIDRLNGKDVQENKTAA